MGRGLTLGRMPGHLRVATSHEHRMQAAVPVTVVLVDDHAGMRRSLRSLLEGEDDIRVVGEAGDMEAAVAEVERAAPDVLVLDARLPDRRGVEAIHELRAGAPAMEIVVVTMDHSAAFAHHALEAGAVGFVLKDKADSDLAPAVRAASEREEFVSPGVAPGLAALRGALGDGLTARETEILRLIALGHTSAEIGRLLRVSRRTVETHRARIYEKLGLHTRAELVAYALRRRLLVQ